MSRRKGREKKKRRKERKKEKGAGAGAGRPAAPALTDALREGAGRFFRSPWAPAAALAALAFALYARSIDDPLIYWDDNLYVLEDTRVQELSLANARRIVTESYAANYHPLTTFTFAVDRAIWGDRLAGFHVTQLAFYAAGVVLLFYVFRAVLKSAPAAFLGAAVYAAHAIHVESVAWLASRKDVVCLVFYAGAVLAYFRYAGEDERPTLWRRYALFVSLAAAAMLSKGYAVVLPAVLLAYDWCLGKGLGRRQILDKLPLFALGLLLTAVMIAAQEKDAAPKGEIDTGLRLAAQCKIYAVYAARVLLPVELSIDYRHVTRTDWLNAWVAVLGAGLLAATVAGFFVLRKRLPAAAWGIAILLGQLATVMSVFHTLRQWMTDRYLFFPTVGSTLALTAAGLWLHGRLCRKTPVPGTVRRVGVPAAAAGVVVLYAVLTVLRLGDWRSELAIWSDAVRKQQGMAGSGPLALRELEGQTFSELGALLRVLEAYKREGRFDEARKLRDAIGPVPADLARGHEIQLARHDIEAGRYDEAIAKLTPVAERGKFSARRAWLWIAEAQRLKGEPGKARVAYEKSLALSGEGGRAAATVMVELGNLHFAEGRFEEAAGLYERARGHVGPANPRADFYLGLTYERQGRLEEAYALCKGTLALEGKVPPNVPFKFADVYLELGIIAKKLGRKEEAAAHYEEALTRAPDHPRREGIRREIKVLRDAAARERKPRTP